MATWLRLLALAAILSPLQASTILLPPNAPSALRLASSELRRYLYAAGIDAAPATLAVASSRADVAAALALGPTFVIAAAPDARALLGADAPTPPSPGLELAAGPAAGLVTLVGSDAQHALYAVYTLLEHLGLSFTSAGATLPAPGRARALPEPGWSSRAAPAFSTRGLQPFHDFAEGPDWWSTDEIKRVTEAVLSMRGNLIGFHNYPLIEPGLWVGLAADVLPGGNVSAASSYPTRWATTLEVANGQTTWGYMSTNTSALGYGAGALYEHECFGHETVSGDAALCPIPTTPADSAELFNRVGLFFKGAFAHAQALGVATALGTEIPLSIPGGLNVSSLAYYEGIFTRLEALFAGNLTYYWAWTPEK